MVRMWRPQLENEPPENIYDRQRYVDVCVGLHRATLSGNWNAAETLLLHNTSLATTGITEGKETALHLAAARGNVRFVTGLLAIMTEADLETENTNGCTALCFAAAAGHVAIADLIVRKNSNLPTIGGEKGLTPLYMAAQRGHSEMVDYLLPLSNLQSWTHKHQIDLLTTSVQSGFYDLAMGIVSQNPNFAVAEDSNGETPLEVLARMPSAFCGTSRQGFLGTIASTMRSMRSRNTAAPRDAYALLGCLWNSLISLRVRDMESAELLDNIAHLLFEAAELGNDDFLVELIRRYPDFIYKVNKSHYSIFHIAVVHRRVKVFNLVYELPHIKDIIISYTDEEHNNILHLAAKVPSKYQLHDIPGAALRMQQEVLWFKEVEKIVPPLSRVMKNKAKKTPRDLFLEQHKNLMKKGEKEMKHVANSCMLLSILITTVVFTTAFTVPGGYDNSSGTPVLQNKNKLYIAFPISVVVAALASFISMLMFLSLLTSRYSDNDFLRSLPFCLVFGVVALFVSVVAMIATFCTCILLYGGGSTPLTVLLALLVSVPPSIFLMSNYHLLLTIVHCTYGSKWLFGPKNRLFV